MLTRILSAFGFEKRVTDSPFAPDTWGRAVRPATSVSPGSVLSNLAVAARCVSLRSELLASVPLKLFRRLPDGSRERVSDSALAEVLADLANPLQTAFEAREFMVRSLDLHGNAYARIERDGAGAVTALWPLDPTRMMVERLENGRVRFRYSGDRGATVLLNEEVLFIRASSDGEGLIGRSPISIARNALALGVNLTDAAGSLAANGMRINGVISHPGRLNEDAKSNIRRSIEKEHAGPQKSGRVLVMEEGSKFIPTQFSAQDSQFVEHISNNNEDVARIFGVPPASVGISSSVSYGSAQQAAQDLVQNALAPLAARIEQAMQRCLLSSAGRRNFIIEHDLSGLLRGDATSRWTAYRTAREIGVMSAKEIRATENLGPMDPADDYTPLRASPQQAEPPIATVKP